jgi:hypothetical protein
VEKPEERVSRMTTSNLSFIEGDHNNKISIKRNNIELQLKGKKAPDMFFDFTPVTPMGKPT